MAIDLKMIEKVHAKFREKYPRRSVESMTAEECKELLEVVNESDRDMSARTAEDRNPVLDRKPD